MVKSQSAPEPVMHCFDYTQAGTTPAAAVLK